MICGICRERKGKPLCFITVDDDGNPTECVCHICHPHRCEECQETWGKDPGPITPHKLPRRREAVLATRKKQNPACG